MSSLSPHAEPVWPLLAITTAAALLIGLTLWTYQGVQGITRSRWWTLLGLRLAALAVACVVLLRPTWEYRELQANPPLLVVLIDGTKSMVVRDEDPNLSRWEAAVRDWEQVESLLARLEAEQRIKVVAYQFDNQLRELNWRAGPEGDRTAITRALDLAYEHHKPFAGDKTSPLLGMVLVSDGRDNVGKPALESVLAKLARAPCPVHVIGMGQPGGSELQPDLVALGIDAPATARVKDKLLVQGQIQAQRFVNQDVEIWLKIDGQTVDQADKPGEKVRVVVKPEAPVQTMRIEFPAARLPDVPGDVRVSYWIRPLKGELTDTNNEASTYVTLIKEGLSVLYFDKDRAWESKAIRRILKGDERITPYFHYLGEDKGPKADEWRRERRADLEKNHYDVFVFGDMPASRFAPQTPDGAAILKSIEESVSQGSGLIMTGGQESFAEGRDGMGQGSWRGTPLETLLPVDLNTRGQLEGAAGNQREIKFVPTEEGLRHFGLRLDADPQKNRDWWNRLHTVDGGNRLGSTKAGSTTLARSAEGEPLLVWHQYGKGRVAALAIDTTWRWDRPGPPINPADKDRPGAMSEGREAHLRFWRQMILWLAQQEEAGKSVRIELDQRRLAAGKEQGITVQAREVTPGGNRDSQKPLQGAEFNVRVIKPDKSEELVPVMPTGNVDGKSHGAFWKTDDVGEYEVIVSARYLGADLGQARARFMTYRDDSELVNRTANHAMLEQIARATGGTFRLHGGMGDLLAELHPESAIETVKLIKLPNWDEADPFLQGFVMMVFVGLLCAEWFCRRWWGLV